MDWNQQALVADECHKLISNLRTMNQQFSTANLLEKFEAIKYKIWKNSDMNTQEIVSPFFQILETSVSSDILTLAAVKSIHRFLNFHLISTSDGIDKIVEKVSSCKYQITSDYESYEVNFTMLSIYQTLASNFNSMISLSSAHTIFRYCISELQNLSSLGFQSINHSDVLCSIFVTMFQKSSFSSLVNSLFQSLLFIVEKHFNSLSIEICLNIFITIAFFDSQNQSSQFCNISCVLLSRQLSYQEDIKVLVLTLRLFFRVFSQKWQEFSSIFSISLGNISNFLSNSRINTKVKAIVFDVIIDFFSLPNFCVDFYSMFHGQDSCFASIITSIFPFTNFSKQWSDLHYQVLRFFALIIEKLDFNSQSLSTDDSYDISDDTIPNLINEIIEFSNSINSSAKFAQKCGKPPEEVAWFLLVSPSIERSIIGEVFAGNDSFHIQLILAFLKLFDFSNLSFDQSIRVFLSSFKIGSESQIIYRNLEFFSQVYAESHPNEISPDYQGVHSLAYAWLMLHTEFHNPNVKDKRSLSSFIDGLKSLNNGLDFDSQLIIEIYESVSRHKLPILKEDSFLSLEYWELQTQKQHCFHKLYPSKKYPQSFSISQMFQELWPKIAPVFSSLFHVSENERNLALKTFVLSSRIASHFSLIGILDNIVITLVKFSQKLHQRQSQDAFQALFSIVSESGSKIQEAWSWVLDILIQLFQQDLLPLRFREKKTTTNGLTFEISYQKPLIGEKKSGKLVSFFKNLAGLDRPSDSDEENIHQDHNLISFVQESLESFTVENSVHYSDPSYFQFLNSFLNTAEKFLESPIPHYSEMSLCIHIISQVVILNPERALPFWPRVSYLFSSIFSSNMIHQFSSLFILSTIFSLFHMLEVLWSQPNLRTELVSFFDLLASINSSDPQEYLHHILNGIYQFFKLHFSSFEPYFLNKSLLSLLSQGMNFDKPKISDLFHEIVQHFLGSASKPSVELFHDFWLQFIQTSAKFAIYEQGLDYFTRFKDLQQIFFEFLSLNPSAQNCSIIFDEIFLAHMKILLDTVTNKKACDENLVIRISIFIRTIFKSFAQTVEKIANFSLFENIWLNLLQLSINMVNTNQNEFQEQIPQLIGNTMVSMVVCCIFDNLDYNETFKKSYAIVESISPQFVTILSEFSIVQILQTNQNDNS
jgi:hypothetical protein